MADGALIQYLAPGSFIKNVAVLSVVYVVVTNGLAYVLRLLQPGGSVPGVTPFLGGATALNVVFGLIGAVLGACLTVVVFNWVAGRGSGFPVRFRAPAPWVSGTRELRRIGPVSAMITGALGGAAGGLLVMLLALVLGGALSGAMGGGFGSQGAAAAAVLLVGMPVGMGVWLGLVALGLSALYNVLAPAWGGVQFESAIAPAAGLGHSVRPDDRSARVSGVGVWQTGLIVAAEALVLAVIVIVIVLVGMSSFMSGAGMGAMAAAGSVVAVAAALVVYPVLGFISGAVTALVFNLAGLIAGGVEVEAVG
jgi:hypothetical protein